MEQEVIKFKRTNSIGDLKIKKLKIIEDFVWIKVWIAKKNKLGFKILKL
jgi:hypothetical protein